MWKTNTFPIDIMEYEIINSVLRMLNHSKHFCRENKEHQKAYTQ